MFLLPTDDFPDLAEEIARFLENLPDTIRPDILFSVMIYANDEASMEADTLLPKISDQLTKTGGMRRMS